MLSKSIYKYLLGSSILLSTTVVFADNKLNYQPGNHFDFNLESKLTTEDNYLLSQGNKESAQYLAISPIVNFQVQKEAHLLHLNLNSTLRKYSSFQEDDHFEYQFSPSYLHKLSDKQTIYVKAKISKEFENRGTGASLGNGESLEKGDKKQNQGAYLGYVFGSLDSVAQLSVELGKNKKEYNTRRALTNVLDQEQNSLITSFDYLMTDSLYLATELGLREHTFNNNQQLNDKQNFALLGVTWMPTDISSFTGLLGYQKIKFKQNTFGTESTGKWKVSFNWKPLEHTQLLLKSARDFGVSEQLENSYRVNDSYSVSLSHQLNDRLMLETAVLFNMDEVQFVDTKINEDYKQLNLSLAYRSHEWLTWSFNYGFDDREASIEAYQYQRNSFSFGINVSI